MVAIILFISVSEVIKKRLCLFGALVISICMMIGCSTNGNNQEYPGGTEDMPDTDKSVFTDDYANGESIGEPVFTDKRSNGESIGESMFTGKYIGGESIFDFVVLGQYMGIEYDPITVSAVTEEDIDGLIELHMSQAPDFEEGAPELSDEFLQEYLNVASVEEYRAIIRGQLEKDKALEAENGIKRQVWNEVLKNATIIKYPEEEVEFRKARAMMEFNYNAAKYNIEISEFIAQISGMAMDEFIEKEIMPGAMTDVKQDLVIRAIAAKEGLNVTKDEFDKEVKRFVEEYGYESEEAFLTLNGENAVWIALLSGKVIDTLMATAIEK